MGHVSVHIVAFLCGFLIYWHHARIQSIPVTEEILGILLAIELQTVCMGVVTFLDIEIQLPTGVGPDFIESRI